jgi:type IV secretory pathway VirB4 component
MNLEKGNENGNNTITNEPGAPVGAPTATSGADSDKTYDESFVSKLKGEKDNFRSANQKLQEQVEALNKKIREGEEKALKEKEDYKALYEQQKQRVEELTGVVDKAKTERVTATKTVELKKELQKLGLKPEYVEKAVQLAQLDTVQIDKETGTIYGADLVAKTLSEEWPVLFGAETDNVTQNAPQVARPTGALTLEEWQKLPYAERKQREGELFGSQGVNLKR